MASEQEEKVCLFCLETKKGRRQHLPIEFNGLFPCECIFQCHAECIIKWQIHCLDDIQCPICRSHLIVPEEDRFLGAIILFQPQPASPAHLKKIVYYFLLYVLCIVVLFIILGLRL